MKKKLLAMALLFSIVLPTIAFADTKYGKVTDISKSDTVKSGTGESLDVKITGNETANVIVEYGKEKGITLQYLSNSGDRPDNAAWLGIHVTVPTDITSSSARYTVNGGNEMTLPSDGDYYFGITADKLIAASKEGKPITYTCVFKWSSDRSQTVTIKIYPKSITLLDKEAKDSNTLWDPDDYITYAPKDDVPKTGDTYPIVLITLFVSLLIVGSYNLVLAKSKE